MKHKKGWIAIIAVIVILALAFVGYNIYRYPAMFRSLTDNSLSDSQVEELREEIVFVGYPNWNADLPMPLYTFLEEYDFGGKTIIPFTTHGGSGFSGTIQTISELQPNATVISDGLSISRNSVPEAEGEVIDWVNRLGLNQ